MIKATFEAKLPCGGKLRISDSEWGIYYYFPGPDRRYKGTHVHIPGNSINQYISAYDENFLEYEQLKQTIPAGGQFSKPAKMGMSIRIGPLFDGVCLQSYHMPVSTRAQLKKVLDGYRDASRQVNEFRNHITSIEIVAESEIKIQERFGKIDVATGSVKWWVDAKGFGFIIPDDGSEDIFAHNSEVVMDGFKSLREGQRVEYSPGQGPKGPMAFGIRLLLSSASKTDVALIVQSIAVASTNSLSIEERQRERSREEAKAVTAAKAASATTTVMTTIPDCQTIVTLTKSESDLFDPYASQRHKRGRKSHLAAAINQNVHDHPAMGFVWLVIFVVLIVGSFTLAIFK